MRKAGFDNHFVLFLANYLMDRKTNYFWNNFMSSIFNVNVGVGQGSALLPILFALYLLPFIYILENHLKNLKIPISIISFVDDGLFISQSNSFDISNSRIFCSYNILTNLLEKFGLVVKHSKTEIFHFLTYLSIPTNLNWSLSYWIFINSSIAVKPIPSNFGNAQAVSNGTLIMKLTKKPKKPKCSILCHSTYVKIHGNSAKRVKVITY